jgi:phosphonate transport system substrate-binding protein
MLAAADGSFGHEMEIITYPVSGVESVDDIRERTLAFTSETSNSGLKAPSAILMAEFGMVAGEDFEPTFSGAHDNSIHGVANQDDIATSIANSVKGRTIDRGVVSDGQLVTVHTSQTFPRTGYDIAHNLTPEPQANISSSRSAFGKTGR